MSAACCKCSSFNFSQTLRQEYMTRLEKARSEIQRKVEILECNKRQQQSQLMRLRGEKKELTSKAASNTQLDMLYLKPCFSQLSGWSDW